MSLIDFYCGNISFLSEKENIHDVQSFCFLLVEREAYIQKDGDKVVESRSFILKAASWLCLGES